MKLNDLIQKYLDHKNEYIQKSIYDGAGFGENVTFMKIKDRWKKLYKYQKERDNEIR